MFFFAEHANKLAEDQLDVVYRLIEKSTEHDVSVIIQSL